MRRWIVRALLVLVTASVMTGAPNSALSQTGLGLAVIPAFPTNVTVGDQNQAAFLRISNQSLGVPAENQPLTLTSIQLDPSCNQSTFPCPQHEPNVFCIDGQTGTPCPTPGPQPVGRAGTACAGITFTVQGDARTGTVTFVPNTPTGTITLGPANPGGGQAQCIIDFTFDVVGRPSLDPVGQTFAVAGVQFTSPITPTPTLNTGNTPPITVNQATLTLRTQATPQGDVPFGAVTTTDTAFLTETVPEANPTGTVTFRLAGPTTPGGGPAADCSAAIVPGSEQTVPVAPNGQATTAPVVVNTPGQYNWVATYNGDLNFAPTGPVGCGDPAERFRILPPPPEINVIKDVVGSNTHTEGDTTPFTFQITIENTGPNPVTIQTINDDVYGDVTQIPGNTCAALIGQTLAPEGQPGDTLTCQFQGAFNGPGQQTDTVTVTGVDPFGQQVTDSDDATVFVTNIPPQINVEKTANPTTIGENDSRTVTFTVVVSNPNPNEELVITGLTDSVYGNLATRPGSTCGALIGQRIAPGGAPRTCTFTAEITGGPGTHTNVVTATGTDDEGSPPVSDTDDATVTIVNVPPQINVDKTANPTQINEQDPRTVTFTVVVSNPSPNEELVITGLTDSVYGDLATRPGSTCGALIGQRIAPGGAPRTCTFTADITGGAGTTHTNVVTATGTDDEGSPPVTDNDDATVTIVDVPPVIGITKTVNPESRTAPGGTFTYTLVITNNSGPTDPVDILTLTDTPYAAEIAASPSCQAIVNDPNRIPPGESRTCTFDATFTGNAGDAQTDTATVTGEDDEGTDAPPASDQATVFLTGQPVIEVIKDATPATRPEPGGDFTYTIRVRNLSTTPVTITSLVDDVYGDLATRPGSTCGQLIGDVLQPNATSDPCSFTAPFNGEPGDELTDTVTATAVDPTGNTVTDTDPATVGITNIPPQIEVTKTADPLTRQAPGGQFTFTVRVRNPSPNEVLIIRSLTDDVYPAEIAASPSCQALIGDVLQPGALSDTCTFTGNFTGAAGATQTDTVTATGTDDDDPNNIVTDTDDATVSLIGVEPRILVEKTASPESRPEPGGAFTFTVRITNTGPNTLTITSITDDVYPASVVTPPGSSCANLIGTTLASQASTTCTFTGNFTGNAGDAQTDTVTVTGRDPNGTTVTDNDDATVRITGLPSAIQVVKDANPLSRPEPGGTFTFTVTVTNPSTVDRVRITGLTDDIYGDLATRPAPAGGTACSTLIGRVLEPNQTATCQFTGTFTGRGGDAQTDIVTVTGVDDDGQTLTDNDDATVRITNVPPAINVVKDADPASRPEPGGNFTFTVRVTNESAVDRLTITDIRDDVYGDLNGRGTCRIGAVLQPFPGPGNVYTCSFTAEFRGNAGDRQTDVVTVTGEDDEGTRVSDNDDATVFLTNVPPTVRLEKTADPTSRPEPGGTFTFTVRVINTSNEPVTITRLVDDVYGNLAGRGTCAVGARLNPAPGPGNVYTCQFTATFTGDAGARQTDIITVTVVDDENTPANATDDATVTITNVLPTIEVTKTPSPASRTVPGGDFTFTVSVRNTSSEPVRITGLSDDVFGNLNGRGTCVTGTVLQPNAVYTCSFTGTVQSNTPGSHTDVVTATAVDNEGSLAVDQAQATVRLEAAPPVVVVQNQQIARTGEDSRGAFGLAALMVALGMILVALGRKRGLAFAPAGDDGPFTPPWGSRPGTGLGLGLGGDAPLGGSERPRPSRTLWALGAAFRRSDADAHQAADRPSSSRRLRRRR